MTFIPHRITYYVAQDRSMTPSSLQFQHLQNFLKITHTSCLRLLLPHLTVPSSFPSITCFRKQFLHKMWPTQFAFLFCNVWTFLSSLTPCNTSSFLTRSVQLIFSILHQHHIPKLSGYFRSTFRNVQVSTPYKAMLQCCILLVSSLQWSPICWYRVFLLLNAAFAMAILHLISRAHPASFAIMPPKHFKYSTQSYLNIKLYQFLIIKFETFSG